MRQDDSYLLDMLVAARKAVTFAADLAYAQFEQSDLHQNAIFKVWRLLVRLPPASVTAPKQPIRKSLGRKSSGYVTGSSTFYFEIDLSLVWQIVREDVPALIVQLERLVPPEAG